MVRTKLPDLNDTIVALSSASGPGGRAIVRLSGRLAAGIVSGICANLDAHSFPRSHVFAAKLRVLSLHIPLEADIYYFAAPRTYTGQDLIEIHIISSPPLVDAVIADCLNAGARAAQAGEFTMRAFLSGKLDLTRAEAVLGVIEAGDSNELKQALQQLAGGLAQPLVAVREDLLNLLADIEAGLDFSDEDLHFATAADMLKRLGAGLAHLTILKKQLQRRTLNQRPFRVVFAGKPNAGKSSLFNALVGADAALVSAAPGTTRDYLKRTMTLGDATIELIDTAGLAESSCTIESAAQALGKEQARQADLVLWCMACDDPDADFPIGVLAIATKADLASPPPTVLATSAATGAGLAELRDRLGSELRRSGHASLAPSLSRCGHHVDACLQHLRHAHTLVIDEGMPEFLALEVRLALEELGALVGAVYTDDLLDRIFSRFCIGK